MIRIMRKIIKYLPSTDVAGTQVIEIQRCFYVEIVRRYLDGFSVPGNLPLYPAKRKPIK